MGELWVWGEQLSRHLISTGNRCPPPWPQHNLDRVRVYPQFPQTVSQALGFFCCGQVTLPLLVTPRQNLAVNNLTRIRPLHREQLFALERLLNDVIPRVTLKGKAGTGKTRLAIAAGGHLVTYGWSSYEQRCCALDRGYGHPLIAYRWPSWGRIAPAVGNRPGCACVF